MTLINDKNLSRIIFSAIAVSLSLIWLFLGYFVLELVFPERHVEKIYIFFSGVIFTLGFIGIYFFIKTILYFTEFLVQEENLPLLLYRSVLDEDSEGIFFKDHKGRYRVINAVAQKVLNLQGKDVIGYTDTQLHNPVLAHKIELEDKRVLNNGETIDWDTERDTGNGLDSYVCKKIPCRNRKGKIIGITGICKNITIMRTFQKVNRELEERYRSLFNKLPYPVLVLDTVTLLPFTFNESMCVLLKYNKEEFSRLRLSVHIRDENLEHFRSMIIELLRNGGGEFDLQLKTKDKDTVDVSGYAQEVIIDDKRYLHMLLHDVTETKRSTNELIGSELKYRSLFEYANDAILIVDVKTLQIIDANEIAISFLGYNRDNITLMTIMDLDASSNHNITQEQLNTLEIYNHALYEHEIKNRKGEVFNVEINVHKVTYGEEEVFQYVIRNITERKQIEKALRNSEQRYRQMFESNQAIKLVVDPERHCIEDANPAAEEFYGYSIDELRGMSLSKINILSEEKLSELIRQAKEQNLGFYSCPHRLADGDIRFVEVRDGSMEIENKTLLYSIIHDVTASKKAEDQLVLASKMFDCSTDAVMITDKNNYIISTNQAFSQITEYQQSEVLGKEPNIITAGRDDNIISRHVIDKVESEGQWQGEIWHRLKNGETRPLIATVNIVRDNDGEIANHVILMSPKVTDDTSRESNLISNYVGLTSLPNKSLFIDRLTNAIERSQRSSKQLAVLLIDFKNFSDINKAYGYDVGDHILQAIAKRLKYNIRESDTVAHFSSDDFAVLLEDLADIQQTGIVAQKIISTLSEAFQVDEIVITLEISIGISVSPEDGVEAEQLLEKAAKALLMSQNKAGNNFQLTSSVLNENAHMWLQTDENLHKALKNDEFTVFYLPQMHVSDKTSIEGLEALVRWRHEGQGMLLPLRFLPNAEQSGFISAIGYSVIDKALVQFKQWQTEKVGVNRLSINICQSQIDSDLAEYLIKQCDKNEIQYDQIALDFTESKFITSTGDQKDVLRKLQNNGFKICVDDFGSGAASLSCLLQCPVNSIKIDRSLVSRSTSSEDAKNLLSGLVALANHLDIEVVAEGVETEAQLKILSSLGCHHMQGYYFSQPMSAEYVAGFISKNNHG